MARAHIAAFPKADAQAPIPARVMITSARVVTEAFTTVIGSALETTFALVPRLDEPSRTRRNTSGKAEYDRVADARHTVIALTQSHTVRAEGIQCALEAAMAALAMRDFMTANVFQSIYHWVEPDLPITEIEADAANAVAQTREHTDGPTDPPADAG